MRGPWFIVCGCLAACLSKPPPPGEGDDDPRCSSPAQASAMLLEDAQINGVVPTQNEGGAPIVLVQGEVFGLWKFELPPQAAPADLVGAELVLRYPPTDAVCGATCTDPCATSDTDLTVDLHVVFGDWFEDTVTWGCRHTTGGPCTAWEVAGAMGAADRSTANERVDHAEEMDTTVTIGGPLLEEIQRLPSRQVSFVAVGLSMAGQMMTASSERTCTPPMPPTLVVDYCE